nr:hypothetical protein [Tanacetum cinerariifolium]
MHVILGVYTVLDEVTNLQRDYLELLEKCEGLETELSKSNMMIKSFESVQKHAINLELELQQCKEKIKNDMSFKVNKSKDFCKEREQYFKIQDLKAQLQDKGIVISELKKIIEKIKGKSVDTKFEKSSVIRQPNAFKSQRPSVLGKPTTFSNSFVRKDFSKSTCLNEEIVPDLRYFNSLESEVDSLRSQLETQKTKFLNEINRLSKEYYYVNHMNAILGVYTELDEVTNLQIFLFIFDSGCSKHMTRNLKHLINFMEKFLGTVKFRNDQIASILRYGDLVQGAVTIKRVYYVEGLNHNLFSIGQFCDADLEVAFRKSACFIHDLKGNDLLTAWLWHRRLSHLNFDTINLLSKNDIVVGLPKLKFIKDHLCPSCLRMKHLKFSLISSRLSKRGLQAQVRVVRTDKGIEFLNQTLNAYFAVEGILHQTSVVRTPEQNGVVERRNRTLVEAA